MKSSISDRRLVRNSMFNLLGQGVPLVAALFAIPLLINGLGTDRFGVLTLAWMVIGYFSLFDLGLGRALTQVVAEQLSEGSDTRTSPIVWTALTIMLVLGFVGAGIVALISPSLTGSILKIPPSLQLETLHAFYILAAGIPIVVVTAGLIGILSGFQRFGILNAIKAPMGFYTFLAPLAVLPFSHSLTTVTLVLVLGRLAGATAHFVACRNILPPFHLRQVLQLRSIAPLFRFGVWMTVTNVVSPLMVYLDRFVIGSIVSVAAVAYYATPYEVVTKLLIVPSAILAVLFPAFAASYRQNNARLVELFTRGVKYIAVILFPVMLIITAFANEGLQWWLGNEFALNSTRVLQWLAIGIFINSLAQVFATLIQGIARPDLTAKLHLIEMPIFLPVLWWSIHRFGILGAAVTWTGRVTLDGILLFGLSIQFLGKNPARLKRMVAGVVLAVVGIAGPPFIHPLAPRIVTVSLIFTVFIATVWRIVLADDDRRFIVGRLKMRAS